jgi:hypothetical protein
MSVGSLSFIAMKAFETSLFWFNKIWPWIAIPTLVVGAMFVGLIWGEAKKGLRG